MPARARALPLGVPRRSPDATIRAVHDDLTAGGVQARFGTSIEGRNWAPPGEDYAAPSAKGEIGPVCDYVK
jgi:hypothetical protein